MTQLVVVNQNERGSADFSAVRSVLHVSYMPWQNLASPVKTLRNKDAIYLCMSAADVILSLPVQLETMLR